MFDKIKSLIFNAQGLRQVAIRNTFWLTVGNLLSKILRGVIIIYAARVLGTEGYGIFSYVVSLAAFFTIFSDIGLTSLLTREVVKKPEEIKSYLSTTLIIKLVVLAITIVATVVIGPLFTKIQAAKHLIPLIAFLLAFDSLRSFGFSVTRAKNRMDLEALFTVVTDIAITGLGILGLLLQPTPEILAFSYTAGSGIGFFLLFIVIFREHKELFSHYDSRLVKPILMNAWPFAIMGLLGGFMINIDTIVIGWFRTPSELGLYGATQRLIQLLYVIPGLIGSATFPIISDLIHQKKFEKVRTAIEQSLLVSLAIALPVTLGGILLSGPIIGFFFGKEYLGAVLATQILLSTELLLFPGILIGNAIFAYDEQKIFVFSTGLGAITNLVLDLLLIPTYGIAGSAVATVIAQVLTNGVNWLKLKKISGASVFSKLKIITLSTLCMGATVLLLEFLHVHVVVNIIISGLVYLVFLKIFREPLLQEIGL